MSKQQPLQTAIAKLEKAAAKLKEAADDAHPPQKASRFRAVIDAARGHTPEPPAHESGFEDPQVRLTLLHDEVLDILVRARAEAAVDG